jgi:hypothetical protein
MEGYSEFSPWWLLVPAVLGLILLFPLFLPKSKRWAYLSCLCLMGMLAVGFFWLRDWSMRESLTWWIPRVSPQEYRDFTLDVDSGGGYLSVGYSWTMYRPRTERAEQGSSERAWRAWVRYSWHYKSDALDPRVYPKPRNYGLNPGETFWRRWGFALAASKRGPIENSMLTACFDGSFHVFFPNWALMAVLGVIPGAWLLGGARWKRRQRRRLGMCETCGFNLRAHKPGEKCPECGAVIPGSHKGPEVAGVPGAVEQGGAKSAG